MSYVFDGTGDRLTRSVTNFANGWTGYTVVSWIQSNLTNSDQGWFQLAAPNNSDRFGGVRYDAAGASGGGTNLLKFGLFVNNVEYIVESANNTQTTAVQLVAGRWSSGNNLEIFLDGVVSTPTAQQSATGSISGATYTQITLGAGPKEGASGAFNGSMFETRVYSRSLSDAEIQTIYASQGLDGIVDGLELRYADNEGAPGVSIPGTAGAVRDVGGGGYDLTLAQGNPTFGPRRGLRRRVA